MIAVIKEDFRARTAGAGIAHCPEIIAGSNADNAVIGKTGDLLPVIRGIIVRMVNCDEQLVLRKTEFLRDQVPGEADGIFLEIVAKREIAEHFKESVVTGGIADIVQIVVLATGANAFL